MRDRGIVVLLILGALLLLVLNLPPRLAAQIKAVVRETVAPLQGAVSDVVNNSRETVWAIRGIGGAVEENKKLSEQVIRQQNELHELRQLKEENERLRQLLGFRENAEKHLLPAEVIARDVSGWWQTIRLGKGSADGIQTNMAVMTSDGLIGKTIDVSMHTSDVLLISDPSCKVSGRIPARSAYGVISGRGPAVTGPVSCHMEFINKNARVEVGDEVLTSGLGGVFPPGLLIGYVDNVKMDETGLYQDAEVIPRADLGALPYAFVVFQGPVPVAAASTFETVEGVR